jgi:hypothetical protein
MELDARKYEEARQSLLEHARDDGTGKPKRRNVEHAA